MSYEIPDPDSITVPKLKSILTAEGFGDKLPGTQQKKGYYVDLYRKYVVPLLEARNAAKTRTPGPRASLSSTSAAELASAQAAKQRATQTDVSDRRKTIALAPTTEKKIKTSSSTSKGPSTPAAKVAPAGPAASVPRRLFTVAEEEPQIVVKTAFTDYATPAPAATASSARAPLSTSFSSSSSSSASPARVAPSTPTPSAPAPSTLLSPSASHRATLPAPGPISYPKLSPTDGAPASSAKTSFPPASPSISPDLRQIIASQRAHKKSAAGGNGVLWLLIGLLVVVVAAGAGLLIANGQLPSFLQDKPYFCDTSDHPQRPTDRLKEPVPCVECPLYGVCKDGRLVKCMKGYVTSGGVQCVRDQDIARTIDFCKAEAHKALAKRAGEHQCGYPVSPLPMEEQELKDILKLKVKDAGLFTWDEAKFNEAFFDMKKDLQRTSSHSSITLRTSGGQYSFDTTDVQLPLTCMLQRAALEHIWYIVGTLTLLMVVLRYAQQRRKKAELEEDITSLVQKTKELLKQKKKRGQQPVWVPVIEIRDLIFHEDPVFMERYKTINEKLSVWGVAEKRLRADTRIKEYSQMVEQQQQIVWEYIGTVEEEVAQNILSPRSRKSFPN